ncbi:MAG: prolipoprotein diacylglyceryl transferase [Pseudomonadota bacterium]|nr:prolipoprotein diacylglyceryl transferase [Pseudomonadota bacterium]
MPFPAIPFPAIDPVLIQIGPLAVRWYALAYIAGILLGWAYAGRLLRDDRLWGGPAPLTRADLDDFVLWVTLGIILGGRVGYVLFYNLDYYLDNPWDALALWHGGMSFHGGLLGVVLAVVLFARARGIPMLSLGDVASAAAPIGLFFGRIANFINGELYGRVTDVPWGVIFPNGGPEPRHPSQLYQAVLEGLVLFVVLRILTHHQLALRRPGLTFGVFLAGYAVARILAENFRMPDPQLGFLFGGLTMGMLLSVPMLLLGLALVFHARRRERHDAA